MKTVKVFIMIGVLSLIGSCFGSRYEVFLRSYVLTYYSVDSIELSLRIDTSEKEVIVINVAPTTAQGMISRRLCTHKSKGNEQILYDALCLKHNDMSYNRTIKIHDPGDLPPHRYSGVDFSAIRIVSDSDFDAGHAAGTDLGDIVHYVYFSPKKYIDSGYIDEFDWATADGLAGRFYATQASRFEYPIEKLVSELTPDDLILLGVHSLGGLQFETNPTLSPTHRLTVTMTTDDGRELSASIDLEF